MKQYIETQYRNTLQIHEENGSVTIIPKDPVNRHYVQFLQELEKGEAELIPYVPPATTWEEIRAQRNNLLTASDWSIMADADPKPSKQSWLDYRQLLRDIPQTFSTPEEVVFPNKPE
jgi:hypothetical protein